jgi:hypothetical protein
LAICCYAISGVFFFFLHCFFSYPWVSHAFTYFCGLE